MNHAGLTVSPQASAKSSQLSLRRYWDIYIACVRNSLVREMGFKSNFLLWMVVEALWFSLQITFMVVVYSHTDRIGDWSKWQVVILLGASHFSQQIVTALFVTNLTQLSDNVRLGRLDFMLLLPINTRFIVSLRHVDPGACINALTGLATMVYAARQMHFTVSPGPALGFALLVLAGIVIHYSLMLILAATAFYTVRAQGVVWGYYNLFHLARLPDAAVGPGLFKAFFSFVIPMLLVTNVPVRVLVQKLHSPWDAVQLVALALLCFLMSEAFWRFSIRRYTSASA